MRLGVRCAHLGGAHFLATAAVREIFPGTPASCFGYPAIEEVVLHYDFAEPRPVHVLPKTLEQIEERMNEVVEKDHPLVPARSVDLKKR